MKNTSCERFELNADGGILIKVKCGLCKEGHVFDLFVDDYGIVVQCKMCGADARTKDLEWSLAQYYQVIRKSVIQGKATGFKRKKIEED